MTTKLISPVKKIHTIHNSRNSLQNQMFKLLLKYDKGLNIRQLSRKLNIDKSCASARLNELRSFERITYDDVDYYIVALYQSRDGVTNKTVSYWGVEAFSNTKRA